MKNILLVTLSFIAISNLFCQDSIPDPEFNMRPYYLKDAELVNFERTKGQFETRTKGAYGFKGSSMFLSTFGAESTTRFDSTDMPKFYVKFDPAETFGMKMDPLETITISVSVPGVTKKDKEKRLFEYLSYDYRGNTKDGAKYIVPFEVRKVNEVVYEIYFTTPLPRGEYAFIQGVDLTCFGID